MFVDYFILVHKGQHMQLWDDLKYIYIIIIFYSDIQRQYIYIYITWTLCKHVLGMLYANA